MSRTRIVVTGATGKTGRRVVALLADTNVDVVPVSRTTTVRFDWTDVGTWESALSGASAAYLVHPGFGQDQATKDITEFASVAARLGLTRVVLLSVPLDSDTEPRAVVDAEKAITDAGLALTALRPRWFFQDFSEDFLLDAVLAGQFRLPTGAGSEGFVDADDIAAMAVAALTEDGHAGKEYALTGPRKLTFTEIAEELSAATGRKIVYTALSPDEFVTEQVAAGVPEPAVRFLAELYGQISKNETGPLSNDVEHVLGRPPRDFADFARATSATGVWNER